MNTETTIVIRIYPDLATAQYVVAMLAESGIDAFVGDRNWPQLYPMFAQQADGYKLHIFERDAEKAAEILNAIENETTTH